MLIANVAIAADAPRLLGSHRIAEAYYPPASQRLGETGTVTTHFVLDTDGTVAFPLQAKVSDPYHPRLIAAAERILGTLHFDPKSGHQKRLTARITFQLGECKASQSAPGIDYALDVWT